MKLADKIRQLEKSANSYFSFEYFPPKTETGLQNLYARMDRMAALGPAFVDITWGAGGSTSSQTLDMAIKAQKFLGLDVMMHLTCTNMPCSKLEETLAQAKAGGLHNLLALRGDPPAGSQQWNAVEGGLRYAVDLVQLIRKQHGDHFTLGVAGYPEGHLEAENLDVDLQRLKAKVEAGADFVVTQLFYDVERFLRFRDKARAIGIHCPILPGLLPIQNFDNFKRFVDFCRVHVPADIYAALEPLRQDDAAVKAYGVEQCFQMCQRLQKEGVNGFHFYTLNLESSVKEIVERLRPDLAQPRERSLPWSPAAERTRREQEVRPIFWSNRPKAYVARTREWDDFPNGRWGDSRSPAYGSLSDYHLFHQGLMSAAERADLLKKYGEPKSAADVSQVFCSFLQGQIDRLPWSESPLQLESSQISKELLALNRAGLLTINSQPQANGVDSSDARLGWGSAGGLIYQKAYLEFFISPEQLDRFERSTHDYPSLSWMAVNRQGQRRGNVPDKFVNAVTWGVFPGQEIIQPTIVESESFLAWKDEAFDIWSSDWAQLYPEGHASRRLLQETGERYFLVNVVENDFVRGDIFRVFAPLL